MITVENHFEEDEIWILDTDGGSQDLQVVIRDDTVFMSQNDDEAGMQVIQITPEQFANIFVALQLPQGVYEACHEDGIKKAQVQ